MIGLLFELAKELIQSNPGMVQQAAIGIGRNIERSAAQKEAAEKRRAEEAAKRQEEIERREEEVYELAVELEKKRFLEANEKAKNFDEEVLLEFAEKRLEEQSSARIAEYQDQKNRVDAEIAEIDKLLKNLKRKKADAAKRDTEKKKLKAKFEAEQDRVKRLNAMYAAYISACDKDGKVDDIGMLEIMTSVKKFGIADSELCDIKKFAAEHNYSSDITYMELPKRPALNGVSPAEKKKNNDEIKRITKERSEKESQSALLDELIEVLKNRYFGRNQTTEDAAEDDSEITCLESVGEDAVDEEYVEQESDAVEDSASTFFEIIDQFFERCDGVEGLESLYRGQNIPDEKLSNAVSSMNFQEDTVAILWDTTVFGGAKDGMLVSDAAVYFKNLWEEPMRFTWNKIRQLTNDGEGNFWMGDYSFHALDADAANVVFEALQDTANTLIELKKGRK